MKLYFERHIISWTFKKPSNATKKFINSYIYIITRVNIFHLQHRYHIWMSLYSLIYINLQRQPFFYKLTELLLLDICYIVSLLYFYENKQPQALFLHLTFCSKLFGQVLCVSHLSLSHFHLFFLIPCPFLIQLLSNISSDDTFTLWLDSISRFNDRSWIQQNCQVIIGNTPRTMQNEIHRCLGTWTIFFRCHFQNIIL